MSQKQFKMITYYNFIIMEAAKQELIKNIKEWIQLDNDLLQMQKEMKIKKAKKKSLSENLMGVMKSNQLECFDINGGSILYKKNVSKKPLNPKTLQQILEKFYLNTKTDIPVEEITKFVMDNREEQIKECIKRKMNK